MKPFLLPFLLLLGSLSLPAQLIKDPLFPPSDPPTRPGAPIELCIGNSTPGYAYRLLRNGALVESRQGTGSTICFSGNLSGTYSVTAFDGFVTMPIVSDLLIGHFLSRLTPAFDPARPDIPISFTLADSRIGYRYTLFRNGEAIQELSGTGSPLVFEGNFRGGSYKVGFRYGSGNGFPHLGTNEWWYTGTASATVEVATTGLYAFTCSDSRVFPGLQVEFRLEGSDSGTHYTLWRNGSPLAGGLNGTGGALVFKDVYPAGSYRLRATPPTGPAFDMDGVIVLQDYDIVKLDYQFLMHEFIKFESQPDGWSVQIRLESLPGDLTAPLYPDPNPNDRVLEIGYVPVSRETAWQLWGEFEEIAAAYNAGRVAGWDPAFQIDVNLLHKFLTITVPLNLSSQPRAAVFALVNQSDVNQAEYGRKSIPIRQAGGGELKRYSLEAPTAVQPGRSYSVTLLGSQVGVSYSLYRDGLLAGTKTGKGEEVAFTGLTGFGTYSVVAEYQEQTLSMDNTVTVHDPATLPNYIHTKTFNGGEYAADITFFDGLGRPMQQVGLNAAAGGKDLVTPIAYDLQGREDAKAYLPYARERGNSAYDPVALSAQFAWYGNQYPGEGSYAFQENHYETSLLNRVLYSIQPGRGVRDAAKKAAYGYRTNPANSVRLFRMQADGTLLADGYYPHGTLYEATVTNEDGTTTHTFTDKWENIVLERAVFSDNGQEKVLDTYRVYNPEGRLAYVISPEGAAQLSTPGVFPSTNDVLCRYTCRYEYDAFGRMTLRRLPGAEEEYYVYDRDDRLVLYQDSKLRTGGSRWKLHTYDNAGRLTCEQLITENRSHGELAALFNSGAGNSLYTGTGDLLAEYRYDNYPAGAPGLITTEAQLSSGGIPFSIADVTTYNSAPRGLKTWERLAVLEEGAGGSIERFYFYDNKGRPVQVQEKHDGGQLSYTGYRYDFVGNVLETYERSQRGAGQYDFLHTVNRYDSRNRLLSTASSLNGGDSATVRYAYDDLGRLSARTYGNEVCREVSTYD
ncbi:MAG: DUF6443 domain-containing protein, partial [Culturomica sp.]|nr:DUF6443 domain-containing protein [Culturomica sp.]